MASVQTQPATAVVGQQPLPISVSVITLNEEQNLTRCLESVRVLASEIVVLDSGSVDRTGEIARQFGANFKTQPWQGHVAQKNAALNLCTQPWVLCLDADEALSPELARSIRRLFATGQPNANGFWVNRRTYYLGDWIRHAWYPEWRLRLVRRSHAEWRGLDPHDKLEADGTTARLDGDLLHYPPFASVDDHLQSTISHARIMARSYAAAGRQCHWYHLLLSPWAALFKTYALKQGWRDGWRGLMIACVTLIGTMAKYAFLLEEHHKTGPDSPASR
jgi:glycosyltransferase involved in cell wall biosynthesis